MGEGVTEDRRQTCTKDPWARTKDRGLSLGAMVGRGRGEQWGGVEKGTNVTEQK